MEIGINILEQSWREQALCKGSTLNFYSKRVNKAVMSLCNTCPSKEACYDYALRNEEYGYWGGTTERQRSAERRRLNIVLPETIRQIPGSIHSRRIKPIEHGTENGYRSHNRNQIAFVDETGTLCDCKKAHMRYLREYRLKKSKMTEVA